MSPDTLVIDRTFRGVGRVRRATGTTSAVVRRKMSRMLTTLHEDGRLDLLRAWRDGVVPLLALYDAYRRNALDTLALGDDAAMLADSMRAWVADAAFSAKHAESIETSVRYLEAAQRTARVADLPALVLALRMSLGAKHPVSFNLLRSHASAFIRDTRTKLSPLYLRIRAVEKRPAKRAEVHHPLTPEQAVNWFPSPNADPVDAIAWSMMTTGMHQSELWGRWEIRADRVHIRGTKRQGRKRDVPLIWRPRVPTIHRQTFEKNLRKRTRAFTVRDLRRTYANWMEGAAIPRTRRRGYLGHGTKDVTDLYEAHEVEAFLGADSAKLRVYLVARGVPLPPAAAPLTLVSEAK